MPGNRSVITATTIRGYLACLGCLAFAWTYSLFGQGAWSIPALQTWREPSLIGLAVYLFLFCRYLPDRYFSGLAAVKPAAATIAIGAMAACLIGSMLVLQGFQPSRDEQMAVFDAAVFRSGHLFAPLPLSWQADAEALNLEFMLRVDPTLGWISCYLPMNALIRAGFSLVGAELLAGPVMAAGSIALAWSVAARIWPADRSARIVVCLMLAGSGQFILSGMTAYAMTAHLFCNLLWLRLFLERKLRTDLLAVAVGFIATGLHQPLFHPLFVAPFLTCLIVQREWKRFGIFGAAYLAIGLFWISWPQLMVNHILAEMGGPAPTFASNASHVTRLSDLLNLDMSSLALQAYNVATFFSWQHILLLPMLVFGMRAARGDCLMLALVAGLMLPFAVMLILLPDQGFGYGYRYAHGVLGNAALLAGLAWHRLGQDRKALRPLMARTTAVSIAVLLPFQMWSAYSSFQPFIEADHKIASSGAELIVLDTGWGRHVEILVYNEPNLGNRPIRLLAQKIPDPEGFARRHCTTDGTVAFASEKFYTRGFLPFLPAGAMADRHQIVRLRSALTRSGCRVVTLD